MAIEVDARGLSCPEPVILVRKVIEETDKNEIKVQVSTTVARDNILRTAASLGWHGKVEENDCVFTIYLEKV